MRFYRSPEYLVISFGKYWNNFIVFKNNQAQIRPSTKLSQLFSSTNDLRQEYHISPIFIIKCIYQGKKLDALFVSNLLHPKWMKMRLNIPLSILKVLCLDLWKFTQPLRWNQALSMNYSFSDISAYSKLLENQ